MTMAIGSVKNTLALSPYMVQQQHQQYLKKQAGSVTMFDSVHVDGELNGSGSQQQQQQQQQPPLYPNQQLSVSTLKNSLSVMNLFLPGPARKKGLLDSMIFVGDKE